MARTKTAAKAKSPRKQSPRKASSPKKSVKKASPQKPAKSVRTQSPRKASSPRKSENVSRKASSPRKSTRVLPAFLTKSTKKTSRKRASRKSVKTPLFTAGTMMIKPEFAKRDFDRSAWPSAATRRYNRVESLVTVDGIRRAYANRKLRSDHFFFDVSLPSIHVLNDKQHARQRMRKVNKVKTQVSEAVPVEFKARFEICRGLQKELARSKRLDVSIRRILNAQEGGNLVSMYESGQLKFGQFFLKPCNMERSTEPRHVRSNDRAIPKVLVPAFEELYAYRIHKRRNPALQKYREANEEGIRALVNKRENPSGGELPKGQATKHKRLVNLLLLNGFKHEHSLQHIQDNYDQLIRSKHNNHAIAQEDPNKPLPRAVDHEWKAKRQAWLSKFDKADLDSMDPKIRARLEKFGRETRHKAELEQGKYEKFTRLFIRKGIRFPTWKTPAPVVVAMKPSQKRMSRYERLSGQSLKKSKSPKRTA